ncbi:MAG: queuosine precursor transporter [Legionellaceae bacterium]|nr:queuosine precursor transporter [Legionellaceae bacterium]
MTRLKNVMPNEAVPNVRYKYPCIILGLYVTLLLITVVASNRLTMIGWLLEPGGIYFFPLTFPLLDIVGEVYGYSYPRLFIWVGALCEILFAFALTSVAHFPYPPYFHEAHAYHVVLDPTIRFVFASLLGTVVGEFLNVYLLAKWKVKLHGKSFIMRSIFSTAVGQAALTIIVDLLAFSGKMSWIHLMWMMVCGYFYKLLYSLLFAFPAWVVIKQLKAKEQLDYFDINTNFNPFKLEIERSRPLFDSAGALKS